MDSTPATMDFVLSIDALGGGLLIRRLLAPRDRAALACCSRELAQQWTRGDEAQLRDDQLEAARRFHMQRPRPAGPLFDPRELEFQYLCMQYRFHMAEMMARAANFYRRVGVVFGVRGVWP